MGLGKFRLFLFFLFLFLGGGFTWAESRTECSSLLTPRFYQDPTPIRWDQDFRGLCPVSNQGLLSTCWASAGASFLKPLLVREGLMKPRDELSLDYYSALIMRVFAEVYRKSRTDLIMEELGPYFSTEIYQAILHAGVVLKTEYRFPRLEVPSNSKTTRKSDLRRSADLQEDFIDELNEVRGKRLGARFQEVLDAYLGDPSAVQARPIDPAFIRAHEPEIWVSTSQALQRLIEEGARDPAPRLANRSEIEAQVRASLDAGNPVLVTIRKLQHFEQMRAQEVAQVRESNTEGEFGGEHAVTLVGYGRDAEGRMWYLLQNNSGTRWGYQGSIAVSGEFLGSEIERFFFLR